MASRSIKGIGLVSALCLGGVLSGCAGPYLLRKDPSGLAGYERAGLAWYLQRAIHDGHGRRRKTPWGDDYYEYYLKLVRTERPVGVPNAILHLGSHDTLDGRRYWNLGEAFVQEGCGRAACRAVLDAARRWEKAGQSGADLDPANLELAYRIILELKFREHLHAHRDLAAELHALDGHVILEKGSMIRSMKGFHLDRVDGRAVREALTPKLLAAQDPVFSEAYGRLRELRGAPRR